MAPRQSLWNAARLRAKRRRLIYRAWRKRGELQPVQDRTAAIPPGGILAFTTLRNEALRLPWFFRHYRALGVAHFIVVDNGSDDGCAAWLAAQPDVSLWTTQASYKASRFGVDWITWLMARYGHGHWCLHVDADELLIYPHHETRPLPALTAALEARGQVALGALMLDLYPEGPLGAQGYEGGDPTAVLPLFDAGPYRAQWQLRNGNLWVQGGARARAFFADNPGRAPTLNKLPLVKWSWRNVWQNSTHSLLPPHLNAAYDGPGAATLSGVLLHTKFLPDITDRARSEQVRAQHFHDPAVFDDYYDAVAEAPVLAHDGSVRFTGWQQLETLGLMSRGGWDGA